jgi:hypothetical protein
MSASLFGIRRYYTIQAGGIGTAHTCSKLLTHARFLCSVATAWACGRPSSDGPFEVRVLEFLLRVGLIDPTVAPLNDYLEGQTLSRRIWQES